MYFATQLLYWRATNGPNLLLDPGFTVSGFAAQCVLCTALKCVSTEISPAKTLNQNDQRYPFEYYEKWALLYNSARARTTLYLKMSLDSKCTTYWSTTKYNYFYHSEALGAKITTKKVWIVYSLFL